MLPPHVMHGQWGRMGNVSIMSLQCNETPDDVIIVMMMMMNNMKAFKLYLVLNFEFMTSQIIQDPPENNILLIFL